MSETLQQDSIKSIATLEDSLKILEKPSLEDRLQTPGTVIRIHNRLYVCAKYDSYILTSYYKYYHDHLLFSEKTDDYDFSIHFRTNTTYYTYSSALRYENYSYHKLLSIIKIIDEGQADNEFLDCLRTIHCDTPCISEKDKQEREEKHVTNLTNCIKNTIADIAYVMYKNARHGNEYLIRFDEILTYLKMTENGSSPAFLDVENSDGIKREKTDYIYYIMNKALNNGEPCEIDEKTHLSYTILNMIKTCYPSLQISSGKDGTFLYNIIIRFPIESCLI